MKKPYEYCASGCLTGYGFVFGLTIHFSGAHGFTDMEKIGVIDAPEMIAGGSMLCSDNRASACQSIASRDWPC